MTEEEETIESLRCGLYQELIEIAERLEIQAKRDLETSHMNDAINAALLAFQIKEFAQRFKE